MPPRMSSGYTDMRTSAKRHELTKAMMTAQRTAPTASKTVARTSPVAPLTSVESVES